METKVLAKFAEAVCRVTKDSVASPAGKLLVLRDWQKELLRHALARRGHMNLDVGRVRGPQVAGRVEAVPDDVDALH